MSGNALPALQLQLHKLWWQTVCGVADMQAFKAMMRRESVLIQRTFFVYIFKAVQVSCLPDTEYALLQLCLFQLQYHAVMVVVNPSL